jgi:hypothetical protein
VLVTTLATVVGLVVLVLVLRAERLHGRGGREAAPG